MENEKKIVLNPWDLGLKTLDDGRQVIQLKGSLAFNESFIADCMERGVQAMEIKIEDETVDE